MQCLLIHSHILIKPNFCSDVSQKFIFQSEQYRFSNKTNFSSRIFVNAAKKKGERWQAKPKEFSNCLQRKNAPPKRWQRPENVINQFHSTPNATYFQLMFFLLTYIALSFNKKNVYEEVSH